MARPSAEQRKEMIIEAVLALFREKGMAASSTRDIAERTGLARSHVYHYFKDWKALCLCAVERFTYQEIAEQREWLLPLPAREALPLFVRDNLPTSQDASWAIYLDAWNESLRDPVFAESYRKIILAWREVLEQILQKGIDSGEFVAGDARRLARQITSLINGYADDLILEPTPETVEATYQEIMLVVNQLVLPGPLIAAQAKKGWGGMPAWCLPRFCWLSAGRAMVRYQGAVVDVDYPFVTARCPSSATGSARAARPPSQQGDPG
ncbi:TetR/AcrR family transcriptional regulator [Aeromonas veronii]